MPTSSLPHPYFYSFFITLVSCQVEKNRFVDDDSDGYSIEEGDCDDQNPQIHPEAADECDEIDNNCNGEVDELNRYSFVWYQDADHDGYGGNELIYSCTQPPGYVSNTGDCNDTDDAIHPMVEESLLDIGIDNNCDGFNTEELDIQQRSDIPSHRHFTFVSNFDFMGPTLFFSDPTHNHKFSFHDETIEYEILETETQWKDGFAVRDTDFWYLLKYSQERYEAKQFTSETTIFLSRPIMNMIALEDFWGQYEQATGLLISDDEHQLIVLHSPEQELASTEELALLLVEDALLNFQLVPDVNNDGYAEIWLSYPEYGLLVFGNGNQELDIDVAWKIYYEEPCAKIDFVSWFEPDVLQAICQNEHISIWNVGAPFTSDEATTEDHLTGSSDTTDMVATTQYIIAHHSNDSFVTVHHPNTPSATHIHFSEIATEEVHLFQTPSSASTYNSLFIIDSLESHIFYEEIGLFSQ